MISQREARRLRKRVTELERRELDRRRVWGQEWFGGVNIATIKYEDADHKIPVSIRTARRLGHAVVVVGDDSGQLRFVALPHPKDD